MDVWLSPMPLEVDSSKTKDQKDLSTPNITAEKVKKD